MYIMYFRLCVVYEGWNLVHLYGHCSGLQKCLLFNNIHGLGWAKGLNTHFF